jgi:hypothetical protein
MALTRKAAHLSMRPEMRQTVLHAGRIAKEETLMSRPRLRFSLAVAFVFVSFALGVPTNAWAVKSYPYDCRICQDLPQAGIVTSSFCANPNSGDNGYLGCTERWSLFGQLCIDGKTDCIYVCVGDGCPGSGLGGGGTPGGGGGDSCSSAVSYCPPQCFSCGGMYY